MWGGAVADACKTLAKRLQPLRNQNPEMSFADVRIIAKLLF